MSRAPKGAHQVDIPIEAIMAEVAAWSDEIVKAVSNELLKETRARSRSAFKDHTGRTRKEIKKKRSRLDRETTIVGAFWPTAHLIEFGHAIKIRKNGEVLGHMPASPFLGPAGEAIRDRLPDIINNAVGDLVIEVKK